MICKSIQKIKEVDGMDLLKVVVDDVTAYWFYDYNKALEFLNKEVIVDYRKDILDGTMSLFINTFTAPSKVNVLSAESDLKLYVDAEDNQSNVSFREIALDDTYPNAIVYCTGQKFESSAKSYWVTLTVRDRNMHVANMRIFSYENKDSDLSGQYICANIKRTKYGLQTDEALPVSGDYYPNPELELAEKYINSSLNPIALELYNSTHLSTVLKDYIYLEKGYMLVLLATELSLVHTFKNVTNSLDADILTEIVLSSYLYLLKQDSKLSEPLRNYLIASKLKYTNKEEVLLALDANAEESTPYAVALRKIKDLALFIIKNKKGVCDDV